jgi:hypothetical protein
MILEVDEPLIPQLVLDDLKPAPGINTTRSPGGSKCLGDHNPRYTGGCGSGE